MHPRGPSLFREVAVHADHGQQSSDAICWLQVEDLPDTRSGEHKIKLTSLMVSSELGFLDTWEDTCKPGAEVKDRFAGPANV